MRYRRSVFCATFHRLSPPPSRERPALRCPDFPRAPKGPRSPGLRTEFYLENVRLDPAAQHHLALGTAHDRPVVAHELAAHRALARRPPKVGEELVLERPLQWRHGHK